MKPNAMPCAIENVSGIAASVITAGTYSVESSKSISRTAPIIIDYSKTAHFPNAANCVFTGVALTNNAFNTDAYAKAGGNHLFAADSLGDANALYFTAGPIGEEGGLFGRLNVNGSPMARP